MSELFALSDTDGDEATELGNILDSSTSDRWNRRQDGLVRRHTVAALVSRPSPHSLRILDQPPAS